MSERVGIEEELGKLTICRSVPEVQLAPEIDDETRPRPELLPGDRRNYHPGGGGWGVGTPQWGRFGVD